MVRVRVHATQKEIALITQAARKLGLTASQFIHAAATNLGNRQRLKNVKGRSYGSSPRKKPAHRKRKS